MLAGTGLATWALGRELLPEGAATLAGCAALFSGYALFTAYERTAFAELAGGLWIPLVLLFALRERNAANRTGERSSGSARRLFRQAFDGSAAPLALAIAGAWLSNLTAGLMACYLLAAFALALALLARSWAPVLRGAAGAALGVALVTFYLVPASWEQRWVDIHQATEDPGQTLENNWLFAVHADPSLALHDQVLRTASIIAVLMVAAALGGFLVCALRGRLPGGRRVWISLALIPVAVLFLQLPFSRPLWNLLPDLRFLQFPWRWLLVLEAPMGIFLAAAVWPRESARLRWRVAVAAASAAVFLAMTAVAGQLLFQSCDEDGSVAGMLDTYRSGQGFIGTGEYEPIGADNALIAADLPAICMASDPGLALGSVPAGADPDNPVPRWTAAEGSCLATLNWQVDQPEHKRFATFIGSTADEIHPDLKGRGTFTLHPRFLVLRLRSYPAWRVAVNGDPVRPLPRRDDGLIVVPVGPGTIALTVDWTTTSDVLAGRSISALAVLLLTGLWLLERKLGSRLERRLRQSSPPRLSWER